MRLTGDALRGHTDMILLSIIREKDSYGYEINKTIEEWTDGKFTLTEATLYTSFKRLVQQGYLTSYWMQSDSNKKRKYYSITKKGKDLLNLQIQDWNHMKQMIDKIISK
jgi:DNA-binding PadR family transcriptional regulator